MSYVTITMRREVVWWPYPMTSADLHHQLDTHDPVEVLLTQTGEAHLTPLRAFVNDRHPRFNAAGSVILALLGAPVVPYYGQVVLTCWPNLPSLRPADVELIEATGCMVRNALGKCPADDEATEEVYANARKLAVQLLEKTQPITPARQQQPDAHDLDGWFRSTRQ